MTNGLIEDKFIPVDIRHWWEYISPGLDTVRAKTGAQWRNEDVYAACLNGESFLYMAPDAFVVLEKRTDIYSGLLDCFVWIAWGTRQAQAKYLPQIKEIAREIGAKRLIMESSRKGFLRSAWVPGMTVYTMEV